MSEKWPLLLYIHRTGGWDEPLMEEVELVADEPDEEYEGYVAEGSHKKYLRADTCTPNEECVSRAELRELLDMIERNYGFEPARATLDRVEKKLREVMGK